MDRYYKASEVINMRFVKIPKTILYNQRYSSLGSSEILAYGILQDRFELSIKNGWIDENDNIYMIFDREELGKLLRVDRRTASKYIKELQKHGLLIDKRMGQGKPNRLYMLRPILDDKYIYNIKKTNNETSGNTLIEQKVTSRSDENSHQDVIKSDSSDTDFNETNFIDTVSQSSKTDRLTDLNLNKELFYQEIIETAAINSYFDKQDRDLLKDTVKRLLNLKELKTNGNIYNKESIKYYLKKLTYEDCDTVLRRYSETMRTTYIKNKPQYLNVLLFNCITEKSAIAYIPY